MKKINIIYWISTGLFAALMLFSAIPDALSTKEAVDFMTMLGYPKYFISFIGIVKIIGVIAILLPVPSRLKEWAYAGLAFDLMGAIYSIVAFTLSAGKSLDPSMILLLVWIVPGVFSYIYYHKKLKAQQ
jgi:uncharacterized membrane protein HdeD (DUF308 family)